MLGYQAGSDAPTTTIPRFFNALREMDAILLKVEEMIVTARSHSPFNNYLTQLSAEQCKALNDGISELRTAMLCLVRREDVKLDAPTVNTAWAIRQSLDAAAAKLADVRPLSDIGRDRHHATDLDAPETLLIQMRDVFKRLDRALT